MNSFLGPLIARLRDTRITPEGRTQKMRSLATAVGLIASVGIFRAESSSRGSGAGCRGSSRAEKSPGAICRLRLAGKEVQRSPGPHDIVLRQAGHIECEFVLPGYQDSSKQ